MSYTSRLELQIDSRTAEASLRRTERNLEGVERAGGRADRSMRDMTGSLDGVRRMAVLASGAFAALGVAQFTRNAYAAVSSAQQLQASLKTVTGSVRDASRAWEMLLDFASETPFTLEQSVQGFIRMKSLGLDPTRESLRSFGNTASAMGKDMMQMVEAVADATTGEFERLKEFGIRASKEGEQITFTFQGVETTVRNTSESISHYLQSIGENQFAGAMSDQMDTLGGKMSNLQDSVYQLYIAIGDAGATDAFGSSIDRAANAVERLTQAIEDGAFDDLIGFFQDANAEGNAFIAEIYGIKEESIAMKNTLSAGLLEVEASFLDMRATGVEAFSGLVAGAADTINKGLIPIQQSLSYLDETFANLLENVGNLLGPAGGNFIAQAEAIRDGLIDPQGIVVESLENTSEALREQADAARDSAEAIRLGGNAANSATSSYKPLTEWLFEAANGNSEVSDSSDESNESLENQANAAKGASKEIATLADAYESLLDRITPNRREARQYAQDLGTLNLALASGRMNTTQYMQAMGMLQESFQVAQRDATDIAEVTDVAADEMARAWEEATNRIDETFSDAFAGAFDSFDSFADSLLDGFKRLLAELTYQATLKPIVVAFTGDMQGMMSGGAGGFGNTIGAARSLFSSGSSLLGVGSTAVAAGGLYSGASTGLAAGGLYGNAVTGGVASTGIMSAITSGVSAAMPWIAGGLAVDSLLGGGITKAISGLFGGGKTAPKFELITTDSNTKGHGVFEDYGSGVVSRGAFGAVGFSDQGTARLQETFGGFENATAFLDQIAAMDNALGGLARSEVELSAMASAVKSVRLNAKDVSGITDQLGKRTIAAVSALDGEFGEFVSSLGTDVDTIIARTQSAMGALNLLGAASENLNLQFNASASGALRAADSIAQIAGGIEQLASLQDGYYQAYFSDAERASNLQRELTQALAEMGYALPSTRDGFRALVEQQNQLTESGQRNYVQLLQLAGAFDQMQTMLANAGSGVDSFADQLSRLNDEIGSLEDDVRQAYQAFERQAFDQQVQLLGMMGDEQAALALQRERELLSIDPLLHETQRFIWAMEDEAAAQQDATRAGQEYARSLAQVNDQLSSAFNGISQWVDQQSATAGTPGMNLTEAGDQFARQLVLAQSGDRNALQSITQYAEQYLAAGEAMYASGGAFQRIQGDVLDALKDLPDQISAEEYIAEEVKQALREQTQGISTQLGDVLRGDNPSNIAGNLAGYFTTLAGGIDGVLTREQLAIVMSGKATDAELQAIMRAVDLNGDGVINGLESVVIAGMPTDAVLGTVLRNKMNELDKNQLTHAQVATR